MGSLLQQEATSGNITLSLYEFDIERSPEHDLTRDQLWDKINSLLKEGYILIVSPPCNTFSRARFQWLRHPGPRPLRNVNWPKGFPWLSSKNKAVVEEANSFIFRCIDSCLLCHRCGGKYFWEHPEDLGEVHSEHPASIWRWAEIRDMLVQTNAKTFAIQQCHFGADTPKPTRFLSTMFTDDPRCHFGWPQFSSNVYCGPLPRSCGHVHQQKLIGRQDGKWKTGPSAAYPAGLCEFIAKLCLAASPLVGGGKDDTPSGKDDTPSPSTSTGVAPASTPLVGKSHTSSPSLEVGQKLDTHAILGSTGPSMSSSKSAPSGSSSVQDGFDMASCGNWEHPMWVEWDFKDREFVDGFGLCSPCRWHPWNRGMNRPDSSKQLAIDAYNLLESVVVAELGDVRTMSFKLATGKLEASPFSKTALDGARKRLAKLVGAPESALLVDDGQPFFLRLLACWLRCYGDPDVSVLVDDQFSFASGVYVGEDMPLPRTPQVFPPKDKQKKLDESEFNPIAENYSSAQLSAVELEAKFREEESLGRMFPSKLSVLQKQYGDRLRVASMAAIVKPDGGVRPLHDATHSVKVNNSIVYQDRIQCPGPAEVATVVRETAEMREAPFVISADIKAAHRLVKVCKRDWGLLACRSDSSSTTVWLNTVGTFGVSSAPYWWCRLFACVGRFVGYLFHNQPLFQLVYVDDLLGTFIGARKFLNLWIWLFAFELVGTPFGYHKFSGGYAANFVGYHIRFDLQQVGITSKRGDWLVSWIKTAADSKFVVQARDFREFLGRLGFVAQLLVWLKPHLAPLYAWGSAVAPGTVGKLPETIVLTLLYISLNLKRGSFLLDVKRPLVFAKEAFRTDAKCEDGRVVLGGWECSGDTLAARWFHVEIKPGEAPFLFREEKSQWASTSAELLASLAALHAFGWLQVDNSRKSLSWTLTGGTDNLANQFLTAKRSTTRWPLMIINMQLSHCLSLASLSLKLNWRPREENTLADGITNGDFSPFDASHRVPLKFSDIPQDIIWNLWETKSEFDSLKTEAKFMQGEVSRRKRKRNEDKTHW